MSTLQGKSALITGGSKGIGYAIAEAMVSQGMNVMITARSENDLIQAAQALAKAGTGKVEWMTSDVRKLEDEKVAVGKTIDAFGSLDVLIANAGVGHFGSIQDMSVQQWHDVIDINLTGVFNSVKASLTALEASKGYIITIASLAGTNFFAGGAAYNASKFGLVGFTQAIMLDLRKIGIKVSTIMPGSVATYFNGRTPSDADAWKIQPEDIGQMVIDLLQMPARTLPSKVEMRPSIPKSI
ncbi:MAG: SDR family oxidoreductase [Saprospiraceae bacterium]|nr:SDR family oxidoreductase [Saprospiraceae bacterium]